MNLAPDKPAEFRIDVPLADFTTIHLGGAARYFVACQKIDEIISAISFYRTTGDPMVVLGGGSNVVFPDHGFNGLVLKVELKGVSFADDGDYMIVTAQAGESWDDLVKVCVNKCLAGIECLSGIPGTVGATPIQNVGAYGQEVKDTIASVKVIDRGTLDMTEFNSSDCRFGYRSSRFKREDKDRYLIVEVGYRLKKRGEPIVRYQELNDFLRKRENGAENTETKETNLKAIREAVLTLRKKKSMVIDPQDPNSRSVGSFFVNPVLGNSEFADFLLRVRSLSLDEPHDLFGLYLDNARFLRPSRR